MDLFHTLWLKDFLFWVTSVNEILYWLFENDVAKFDEKAKN